MRKKKKNSKKNPTTQYKCTEFKYPELDLTPTFMEKGQMAFAFKTGSDLPHRLLL